MNTKNFFSLDIEIKSITDDGAYANIKGYGSVFGNVDLGGDVVEKGAFKKSLKDKKGKVPFLADHSYTTASTLGIVTSEEDEYGLKCDFEINLETEKGRDFYALAKQFQKAGMPIGLSIGYKVVKDSFDEAGVRRIKECKLYEVSATPFPMNELASVTSVKSRIQEIEIELKKLKSLQEVEPAAQTTQLENEAEIKNIITQLIQEFKK